MAFQKKFYFNFIDRDNVANRTEIWENSESTITAVEVDGEASPFLEERPVVSKTEPVRGTGCTVTMKSTTNMQFAGLFTADMMQFQIRHYVDDVLVWCGFLDSEQYSEPFDKLTDYPVSVSGNDGLALLERLYFYDTDGLRFDDYTQTMTYWGAINEILSRLNLPWKNLYFKLSTTSSEITLAAGENILMHHHTRMDNWYNEDGEAETMRKVLEELLRPFGAIMLIDNADIIITDINSLMKTDFPTVGDTDTWQKYSLNETIYRWDYDEDVTKSLHIGDLSEIGFMSNRQTLNMKPGVNKQVLRYSPYRMSPILDYEASDEDFSVLNDITSYGTAPYRWTETEFDVSQNWTGSANGAFCKLNGVDDTDVVDYYLRIKGSYTLLNLDDVSFTYSKQIPMLIPNVQYFLKISMQAYFRISDDMGQVPEGAPATLEGYIYAKLLLNGKRYCDNSPFKGWVDDSDTDPSHILLIKFENRLTRDDRGNISEQWIENGNDIPMGTKVIKYPLLIPLDPDDVASGQLELTLGGAYCELVEDPGYYFPEDTRIRSIEITIVNERGEELPEQDYEYNAYLNKQYKEQGQEVNLYLGTNSENFPTERGAMLRYDDTEDQYYNIQEWTRKGVTDIIERLLLRTMVGNYEGKTRELVCQTNKIPTVAGYITYADYLDCKFMVVGCTHDYEEAVSDLTLQEIKMDALIINTVD